MTCFAKKMLSFDLTMNLDPCEKNVVGLSKGCAFSLYIHYYKVQLCRKVISRFCIQNSKYLHISDEPS